jgi:DNA-binding transcriptional MerR regulator
MPKTPTIALPDKLYFKIGEVSKLAGVPPYVLRFWENEFTAIRPKRTPSGQRLYRKTDVETILQIRHLLHEKKYTIKGARQRLTDLRDNRRSEAAQKPGATPLLEEIRSELLRIREMLKD